MAGPSTVFTEMVTTTLRNHPTEVADNVSANNALYNRLKTKGKIVKESGGYEIIRPLDYASNQTYQRYSGYDTLNIQASDVVTAAKFDWVQAAVHITASGRELRMNNGKQQLINLVKTRTKNALRTAANNMSIDIYSDGSLSNQMVGLKGLIQTAGTGTVGGIDSSVYSFWQNQVREMAGTNTWSKSTIRGEMNRLWLALVRGTDKPDLIVASHDVYSAYEESLQDLQRYGDANTAAAGFQTLKYKTADVIFDDNVNFGRTSETAYFLNTDYLDFVVHTDANWQIDDEKVSVNQDAVVIPVLFMGAITVSNRALQGVLIDAA